MRTRVIPVVILLALVALPWPALAGQPGARNFVAHLSGDEEVPPVDTQAQGQAIFQLNKAGEELRFLLLVANIEDINQAHIHCGAEGVNGPVVAFLYPPGPPPALIPGRSDGVLAQGTLTNVNVIPRPDSPQCPDGRADFDELLAKMRSGDTYTNVHTLDHTGGEIRGQIKAAGPPAQ